MKVFSYDRYAPTLPAGHRFPMDKYARLRERVHAECTGLTALEPTAASDGELALAHSPDYVDSVVNGTLSEAALREIGFPWSAPMVERARRSVGATIAAARCALQEGVAVQLGGGTHHAYATKGSGYCIFNDVAVAARLMQAEVHRLRRALLRVWVIDLDVHQGNGTAAIFSDDPTVFTLSLHGRKNFPFRKEASDLDVDLADDCGDAEYLAALDLALTESWRRMTIQGPPGLAFYLAGADAHEGDRLGRLKLTDAGMLERDHRVFQFLHRQGVPVAVTMAGGYGHDIETTVAVQVRTVQAAQQAWMAWQRGDQAGQTPTRLADGPA